MYVFDVRAHWDDQAKVWWADSDDVLGLATEASTYEELGDNIRSVATDLLTLNERRKGEFLIRLTRAK